VAKPDGLTFGTFNGNQILAQSLGAPGTPKERVQILRRASAQTVEDPEFLAEAKKWMSRGWANC
jgi:hypothetical protein